MLGVGHWSRPKGGHAVAKVGGPWEPGVILVHSYLVLVSMLLELGDGGRDSVVSLLGVRNTPIHPVVGDGWHFGALPRGKVAGVGLQTSLIQNSVWQGLGRVHAHSESSP